VPTSQLPSGGDLLGLPIGPKRLLDYPALESAWCLKIDRYTKSKSHLLRLTQ
jgi:hypothetical protein